MITKIFYFSGTGNTLKIAKDLCTELGDAELVKISYDMDFNQQMCNTIGIAYPVYCFGLPNAVKNFINRVQLSQSCYIFGLASYGALLTSSGKILERQLINRGYRLSAGFAIHMPGNAQHVYDVVKQEKISSMYAKAQKKIKVIAEVVRKKQDYKVETNLGPIGKILTNKSEGMMSNIHATCKTFTVEDKCDSCMVCQKVCPVSNISNNNGKPQWADKCEGCMACFQWCPKAAIQANEKTKARGRYHHPDIQLKEIIVK